MPVFQVNTNLPRNKIPANFLQTATELLCKVLSKPKSFLCVHVNTDQMLSFDGTEEPCGYALLSSIGAVGGDLNKELSRVLFELIQRELNIKGTRFYITFIDLPPPDIAFDGKTFDDIFKGK